QVAIATANQRDGPAPWPRPSRLAAARTSASVARMNEMKSRSGLQASVGWARRNGPCSRCETAWAALRSDHPTYCAGHSGPTDDPSRRTRSLRLSCCDAEWRKVARTAGNTLKALEEQGVQVDGTVADQIDARMAVLVGSGQLEAAGNIKKWRYSEVRLAGERV